MSARGPASDEGPEPGPLRAWWCRRWWPGAHLSGMIAALAFAVALGSLAFSARGGRPAPLSPTTPITLTAAPAGAAPVSLRIPAIGVSAPVGDIGPNADSTLDTPADPAAAGWYRLGPSPGQPGSAVILGRPTSTGGPVVFDRLGALRPGDRVDVTRVDGAVVQFVVDGVTTYSDRTFPVEQVYGNHGGRTLQLVTYDGRRAGQWVIHVAWTHLRQAATPTLP